MIDFRDINWDEVLNTAKPEDLDWLEVKIHRKRAESGITKRKTIIFATDVR